MAGIIYPDFARSIGGALQLHQNEQQNAFQMDRMRRADEADAREREASQYVPGALSGDRDALGKVATLSPKTAMSIAPLLERMDSNQRARLKEQFEATGKAAAGILALPEADQPAAYEATYQALTQQGYKINLPPKWSPALKGQLQSYAVQVPEYLKMLGDQPQPMGGAPTPSGGGVSSNNIGNVRPNGQSVGFQQPATLEDGIRLAVNNVKAYPKAFNGGQPMSLVQIGQRWAPKGDGANDPLQWAKNVASIGGLDPSQPLDFNDPMTAAKFARGVHGAEHGAGKVMPVEAYAQALTQGGAPPGVAQGSDMPAADGSGTPAPPQAPQQEVFEINSWLSKAMPGARPMGRGGKPIYDSQGLLMVLKPDGSTGFVEVPKAKDRQQGGGPFGGTSVEAQALNMLIANGTLSQQQAAELAAGKTITNPADGSVMFMTPSGLFGQKPGQPPQPVGAPGAAPPAAGQPGSGMIPVTPPKPVQMTEGQSNAALYADRMREADATITSNEKAGMSLGGKVLEAVPGGAGNYLQSDEYQLFEQARRNFINAVLRRESGAVIADSEFANAEKQYFPRPGDSDAVIKQKAANRRSAIEGVSRAAGSTYKPQGAGPPQAAPESGGEKRLTPEEAQKLPPGTTFIGTDGVQRVRR